jgi:hydrogenase expression/formation protein HypE
MLYLEAELRSDARPVLPLVQASAQAAGPGIRRMQQPKARRGVHFAEQVGDCGLGIHLAEESIPVRDTVRGACELLGMDPLHIANEGQWIC